jgi:NADH-quinone oxidoreductase subunit L
LIGFLFAGFFGSKLPKAVVGAICTGVVFLSFAVAAYLFVIIGASQHTAFLAHWLTVPASGGIPALQVNFELLVDPLSVLMLLIITGVGGLIHLYSTSYMAAESGYARFFTYLNLFVFFMLLLVLANNMVLMFVGWEGVGLCSYLLIGYYYEKKSATDAANKAFIVNRIGDVGVLIGMFMAFKYFHTLDFYNGYAYHQTGIAGILNRAPQLAGLVAATPALSVAITTLCIMVFWGCTGKSAQIPLYVWLPDAMEGPTPVSALIHAATMVTAGVYLVSRAHSLFELSDVAMAVIAIIGIATAFVAATIGLVQNDIKRVLAYSTISQLGYMFAACGVGAFAAGMFHVLTHAFFKACLFLGAGAVIHAMEHSMHERHEREGHGHAAPLIEDGVNRDDPQDMRNMGGLSKRLKITYFTMLASTLAIAGIPPTSGFFSKDEILFQLSRQSWLLWFVGAVTAALTAFYMTRLMYKTFWGSPKTEDAGHTHDASPAMTVPLVILGTLAVVGGFIGLPALFGPNLFERFLDPSTKPAIDHAALTNSDQYQLGLLLVSIAIAIVFVVIALYRYKSVDGGDLLPADQKPKNLTYQILLNKYYVDDFNYAVYVHGGRIFAINLFKDFEELLVDGAVNGVGKLARAVGSLFKSWQTGYVRNYAFTMLIGVIVVLLAVMSSFNHYLPHH